MQEAVAAELAELDSPLPILHTTVKAVVEGFLGLLVKVDIMQAVAAVAVMPVKLTAVWEELAAAAEEADMLLREFKVPAVVVVVDQIQEISTAAPVVTELLLLDIRRENDNENF
jgi:glyoxylate carboligase